MTALVIDSYRAPEEVPGGPPRPGWIVVEDAAANNSASVIVDAGGGVEFAKRVADEIVAALPRASAAAGAGMKQWKITQEGYVVSKALIGVLLGEMIPGKWRRGRAVVVGTMATSHRSLAYVERVVDKLCQRMKRAGYIEHEGQGVWRWRTDVDAKATALELLNNYDEGQRPRP